MSEELSTALSVQLENARVALAEADSKHSEALERVAAIQRRIDETHQKRALIVDRRMAGKVTEAETAELHALGCDLDALGQILQKAQSDVAALSPDLARARLCDAEQAWERHQSETVINAVLTRAKELESRFTLCIGELAALAQNAGHQDFRSIWQPSEALTTCMLHSRPATIARFSEVA